MRIALLTMASPMSNAAVAAFLRDPGGEMVLCGWSDPARPNRGGLAGQLRRHWQRSGPRILPYLALGFGLSRPPRGALLIQDVNGPGFHAALTAARPELIVTCHFDQILAPETLALAPLGGINLHPSLLPRHRGPVPAFWCLAEGTTPGVTIHRLAPRIDAGAILAQQAVTLPPGLSALAAARHLHLAGVTLLRATIAGFPPPDTIAEPLPYQGFPDRAALAAAARRGVRLVRWRDLALLRAG
jgi:methionyl-tRNA formyltransferase